MLTRRGKRWTGAAAALMGSLAFAAAFLAVYPARSALVFNGDDELRAFTSGFYPMEKGDGAPHAWTHPHAEIVVPTLDRHTAWRLSGDMFLWRPADVPLPYISVAVDGVRALQQTIDGNGALSIDLPARKDTQGVTITFDIDPAFVPGEHDGRELGIALASMAIRPLDARPLPPLRVLVYGSIATAAIGVALVTIEVPTLWITFGSLGVAAAQAWLLAHGSAVHTLYPRRLVLLALGLGLGAWLMMRLVEKIQRRPATLMAGIAVAVSLLACYLKLLVLLHPDMQVGDGLFHAHRLGDVLQGRFYFTSIAPGDYRFPYPIALYLVAAPFSWLTPDPFSKIALLRIVVTAADAIAGATLYWMVARATADRPSAVMAVAWYHLIPMSAWVMAWGTLSNAFGQALAVASLAAIVALPVESTNRKTVAALTALTAAAFLSHLSTCAILAVVLAAAALLYELRGGAGLRPAARGVCAAVVLAAIVAFVAYYAWFPAVYRSEISRVASESANRMATPGSSFAQRIALIATLIGQYFGWAAMAAGAAGAWILAKQKATRLNLLLAAWGGTCLWFVAVGIITPVEMRYHFAAFPALAVVAAVGWSWAWRHRLPVRVGAILVLAAAAWIDIRQWTSMLK